ncbi:MAG: hypothetical protein R3255_02555 [Candidatus Lokiarchaeia archaeon]|nr:hypothetical protein [Candidatus Lokiarchaeia archaeon]
MAITKVSAPFLIALTKSPKVALNGKHTNSGLYFTPTLIASRFVGSGITTFIDGSNCSNNVLNATQLGPMFGNERIMCSKTL